MVPFEAIQQLLLVVKSQEFKDRRFSIVEFKQLKNFAKLGQIKWSPEPTLKNGAKHKCLICGF